MPLGRAPVLWCGRLHERREDAATLGEPANEVTESRECRRQRVRVLNIHAHHGDVVLLQCIAFEVTGVAKRR
jgi:hypothetical protein